LAQVHPLTNERHPVPLHAVPAGPRPDLTDGDLARALMTGQPWAPAAVWNRYASTVYAIANRALGREGEAEDITQEVFYRLFARVHTLKEPSAFRSFVVSFAIRIVKWELRRRRVRRFVRLSESGEVPDAPVSGEDAEARQVLRRFYTLLDQLAPRERLVFSLRYLEAMTLEEVAAAMELSLSTVKRSVARAAARVSGWIAGEPDLLAFFEGGPRAKRGPDE
jgi:RNA polymerase sigma-70 factor (ECF subfamily)